MALWQWARIRRARVLTPRRVSQQSIGPGTAPTAFWRNRARSYSSGRVTPGPRRPRRSARPGTWSRSGRPGRPPAPGAAAGTGWRRCCRPRTAPRRHGPPRPPGMCRPPQQRVGRRLHPDQPGLGPDGLLELVQAGHVDHAEPQPPPLEQPGRDAVGPAVHVGRQHQVIAGARVCSTVEVAAIPGEAQRPAPRRHPLQRGQARLQVRPGRVPGRAYVALVPPHRLLGEGRRLVDRRDHRPRRRVGLGPDMHRPGLEVHALEAHAIPFAGSPLSPASMARPISDAPSP